jgi:hypothetical protein
MNIQSSLQEYSLNTFSKDLGQCSSYELLNLIDKLDRYNQDTDEAYMETLIRGEQEDMWGEYEYEQHLKWYDTSYYGLEYRDEYNLIEEARAFTFGIISRVHDVKLFTPVFEHECEAFLEIWKRRLQ